MKETIEFKKDCILKTYVEKIEDISLTHDYKIEDDVIEGFFDISGEYKITASSVDTESFMFTVPFSIALSSVIDKDTINLTISDFNYETEKDVLHLKMQLNMSYEEIKEPEENVVVENEINAFTEENIVSPLEFHNDIFNDAEEVKETKITAEKNEISEKNMNTIFGSMDNDGYSKYKIYIMRENDTPESIALKYGVSMDDIKENNVIENINIGDKIIVPIKENEQI